MYLVPCWSSKIDTRSVKDTCVADSRPVCSQKMAAGGVGAIRQTSRGALGRPRGHEKIGAPKDAHSLRLAYLARSASSIRAFAASTGNLYDLPLSAFTMTGYFGFFVLISMIVPMVSRPTLIRLP